MTTSSRRISVVTPSFDGVDRCRFLLETWVENDTASRDCYVWPHVICADHSPKEHVPALYDALSDEWPVKVFHRDVVGCCDGASRDAIEFALAMQDPEWVLLLSDDLAVTPGAISNIFYFIRENYLETVGAFQPPYWNCTDEGHALDDYCPIVRRQHFYETKEWTRDVPLNPFWQQAGGRAFPYFSVHGSSLVVRAETYREVGGIPEGSWRYDETLSYRIWTRSQKSIVALPGPPLVHYMGGGFQQGPKIDWLRGDEEHFKQATGVTLQEAQEQVATIMAERTPAVNAEMATWRYWDSRNDA